MDVEARNISTLANSRIPEMLGTFHLDDHNVQEWSDATDPGMKHKARKEVGKWIDPNRNADIQFQRHEDSKQSEKSREKQRTEVIQGNAPDAAFQIVRSQRQFQDTDQNSGRVTTMSTSYQMSSTRGTRSTTKTTSNKTTTKTVTVSGGSRSDDFETLKMSYMPLDTSTQREKINVSRSGTMGVRRPPTRRHTHTPVTITPVSPDSMETDSEEETASSTKLESKYEVETFDETSDSTRSTADASSFSIAGFKNISPKIRVGFPVEIQLELQSKLRHSGNGEDIQPIVEDDDLIIQDHSPSPRDEGIDNHLSPSPKSREKSSTDTSKLHFSSNTKSFSSATKYSKGTTETTASQDSAIDDTPNGFSDSIYQQTVRDSDSTKFNNGIKHKITLAASDSEADESYDYTNRRKSYGFEPFDARKNKSYKDSASESSTRSSSRSSHNNLLLPPKTYNPSNLTRRTPPSLSKSWDIIQAAVPTEDTATSTGTTTRKFSSSSSTLNHSERLNTAKDSDKKRYPFTKTPSKQTSKTTIVTLNATPASDGFTTISRDDQATLSNLIRDSTAFTSSSTTDLRNNKNNQFYNMSSSSENNLGASVTNLSFQVENALNDFASHKETIGSELNKYSKILNQVPDPNEFLPKSKSSSSSPAFKRSFDNNLDDSSSSSFNKDWKDPIRAGEMTNLKNDIDQLNESLSKILQGDDMRGLSNMDFKRTKLPESSRTSSSSSHTNTIPSPSSNSSKTTTATPPSSHSNLSLNEKPGTRAQQDYRNSPPDDGDTFGQMSKEKIHQISHTWISPVDQKPSQHARDSNVTTTITATNDQFKKSSKKVEFCKTEVHFTPESGKFNIVESVENKPSTVHLFRRRKKHEKKGTLAASNSNGVGVGHQGEPSTTPPTPTLPPPPTSSQDDQQHHDQNSEKRTSYYMNYHTISEQLKSRLDSVSQGDNNQGPQLLSNPTSATSNVGGDDTSFFHHWNDANLNRPNDVRPEVVTAPSYHPNDPPPLPKFNLNPNNVADETPLTSFESLVQPLKLRRDITQKLLSEDFKDLLDPATDDKFSLYDSDDNKYDSPARPAFVIPSPKSALIHDLLEDLGIDGDEGDETRTEMILSNYGELKIQRYLKQLKSPSSQTGSESSADLLDMDFDPNEEELPSNLRHDNNILYENGSFIPLATRKSLIEMNNRNRKRTTTNSNTSDRSSTTSTYSLPHSDRDATYLKDEYSPFRLPTMEATVSTKGETPKITSVDLRYTLDDAPKSKYSFFPDVTRNYNSKPSPPVVDNQEDDSLLESLIQPSVEPENRSHPPPYFRIPPTNNLPQNITSPEEEEDEDYRADSSFESKPTLYPNKPSIPIPILPSQFSNFQKTGAALRERSTAKSQSFTSSRGDKRLDELSDAGPRTSFKLPAPRPQSKSVVTIGAGSDDPQDFSSVTTTKIEGNRIVNETKFTDQLSRTRDLDEDNYNMSTGDDHTQQEPILSLDHTWKGPAHFEHQSQFNKNSPGVMRSMTFPKASKPEPEWVQKAKSRETRVTDWSLIGKQSSSSSKPDPPWLSEVRVKSKPVVAPPPEYNHSITRQPPVYPWHKDHNAPPSPRVQSPTESTNYQSDHKVNDENNSKSVIITELQENSQPAEYNPPRDRDYYSREQHHPYPSYQDGQGKSFIDLNRDSDSLLINPPQIALTNNYDQIQHRNESEYQHNKRSKHETIREYTPSPEPLPLLKSDPINTKLLAPLLESTKQPLRKPLQSSTNTNSITQKTETSATNSKPRTLPKPPRPPERISSLAKKLPALPLNSPNAPLERKSASPINKKNPSSLPHPVSRARMPTPNNRITPTKDLDDHKNPALKPRTPGTPEYQHPLVKVTKIPTVASSRSSNPTTSSKIPSPRGDRRIPQQATPKNKAKHHVAVVSETKLMCKSKLLASPGDSRLRQQHSPLPGERQPSASPKNLRTKIVNGASANAPHRNR